MNILKQCFSTFFLSCGTFKKLLSVWRNLDTQNSEDFQGIQLRICRTSGFGGTQVEKHWTEEILLEIFNLIFFWRIKKTFKGLYTLDIFAREIAIKRYCNKKIILSHKCLKAKVSSQRKNKSRYINKTQIKVCLWKRLLWLVNRNLRLKIVFLSHIFSSQYC